MSTTVAYVVICHTSFLPKFGYQTLNCPSIRYIVPTKIFSALLLCQKNWFCSKVRLDDWKLETRFSSLLEMLIEKKKKKWISSVAADKALNQYIQLIKNWKSRWMYTGLLSNSLSYLEVWEVVKKCVILSHGTARVEGGFSITNSILQENTKLLLRKKNHARLNFKRGMQRQNDWAELKRAITAKKKAVEYLNNIVSKYESNIHALRATQT